MKRKTSLLIILFLLLASCGYSGYETNSNGYWKESYDITNVINSEQEKDITSSTITLSTPEPTIENNETEEQIIVCDKEILFMNIPWGTSFTKVDKLHGELELWGLSGEHYKTFSVDDILIGEYEGIDFEYSDINIIGNCFHSELEVAGYTTKDVSLYFAFNIVDNTLPKTESESSLYGGQYVFDTENLSETYSD